MFEGGVNACPITHAVIVGLNPSKALSDYRTFPAWRVFTHHTVSMEPEEIMTMLRSISTPAITCLSALLAVSGLIACAGFPETGSAPSSSQTNDPSEPTVPLPPPALRALWASPYQVNTDTAPATTTWTLHLTNLPSIPDHVRFDLMAPSRGCGTHWSYGADIRMISGSLSNGFWEFQLQIPQYAPTGY